MVVVGLSGGATSGAAGKGFPTAAVAGAHECVPRSASERDGARVAWKKLSNPITAQVRDAVTPDISRVHDATATDPSGEWTPPVRLTPGLFEEQRTIDGALAHTEHGLFVIFKRGQHSSSSRSTASGTSC
jgi:hypothetical protein